MRSGLFFVDLEKMAMGTGLLFKIELICCGRLAGLAFALVQGKRSMSLIFTARRMAMGRARVSFKASRYRGRRPAGGKMAAQLFSVLGSAKLHGVEPLAYLTDLISASILDANQPTSPLDQFLPDTWAKNQAITTNT